MDPSMYRAATCGDVGFLQRIRDGVVPTDLLSQKTSKGNNILHLAAEFKQINFFKGVPSFKKGSPLLWNINKMGDTPLHIAARVGCVELVDFLIDRAKMLHVQRVADQERGTTYAETYKKLLRKTNFEKHTALHVAARYGHRQVVILLIKADPELCCSTNSKNESPLFLAICKGFSNIAGDILKEPSISPSFQGISGIYVTLQGAEGNIYAKVWEDIKLISFYFHIFIPRKSAEDCLRNLPFWQMMARCKGPLHLAIILSEEIIDSRYQGSSYGVALFQQQIGCHLEKLEYYPEVVDEREKVNSNLLMATLLGTVTFSASLTPPGGYGSDRKAILDRKYIFHIVSGMQPDVLLFLYPGAYI